MTAMTMRWCLGLLAILSLTMRGVAEEAANPKAAKANYARPFEPPTRPALIPLPPGAIEPQGWLRDWCLTARDGYTGHMDDVAVAFQQAWAADYKMTGDRLFWPNGGWPYEGGGYWFDGLVRAGLCLARRVARGSGKGPARRGHRQHQRQGLFVSLVARPEQSGRHQGGRRQALLRLLLAAMGQRPVRAALAAYCAASKDPRAIAALETAYRGRPEWLRMSWGMSNAWPAFEAYTWSGRPEIKEALTELYAGPGDDDAQVGLEPISPPAQGARAR